MEMATIRLEEAGQKAASELSGADAALHSGAVAMLGPNAVWASIPNQPALSAELEAERSDFVKRMYGAVDQE